MSIWEERLGGYGGGGNGVLSGNLGCGRVMGDWDDTEEGYRVGEVEGISVMQMKADERNKRDLQCDLGSSFQPKQRFSASNSGRDWCLYNGAVYCTFYIEKKVCGCLVGPLIGSDGSKGQAYLYYAANLRIKLQTKNTKLLLCHRVST